MKKSLVALILAAAAVFSGPAHAAGENWYTAGIQTNPAANAIIADTGPLAFPNSGNGSGTMNFTVIVSSTVAAIIHVEIRDAANTAVVRSQAFMVPANTTFQSVKNIAIPLDGGERLRLRMNGAVTGSVQGSIFLQ